MTERVVISAVAMTIRAAGLDAGPSAPFVVGPMAAQTRPLRCARRRAEHISGCRRPAPRLQSGAKGECGSVALVSLAVAVPFGVAAAIAYGGATAVQHQAAHTGTGQADAGKLIRLLRDPRWLLSIGGDTLGLVCQVIALATGPVVLIQPLLVLTLPVSLFVGYLLGGPTPRRGDYLACLSIIGGLAVFFVLLGTPGAGHDPNPRAILATVVVALAAGGALWALVSRQGSILRAGVYGGVAGAWFGTVGVLLNGAAKQFTDHGLRGLLQAAGLAPLLGAVVLGVLGMTLTQISFQVGALAASFPANKSADPVAAVILGAVLLHEHVPAGAAHLLAYLLCLGAIIVGAVQLAASAPAASAEKAAAERERH